MSFLVNAFFWVSHAIKKSIVKIATYFEAEAFEKFIRDFYVWLVVE
jgi:hypothetical protein